MAELQEARAAEHRDMCAALTEAGLNPNRRDGMRFRLHTVDGMSYADIAAAQGCQVHAVEVSIYRVKARLRAYSVATAAPAEEVDAGYADTDHASDLYYCLLNRTEINNPPVPGYKTDPYVCVEEVEDILQGGGGLGVVSDGYVGRLHREAVEYRRAPTWRPAAVSPEACKGLAEKAQRDEQALMGIAGRELSTAEWRQRYGWLQDDLCALREMRELIHYRRRWDDTERGRGRW